MYLRCALLRHVAALYLLAVTCVAADVLVYRLDFHIEVESEFRDLQARFGDSLPLDGLKGLVVYAQPPTACKPIEPPPNLSVPDFPDQWVVLIKRFGGCTFEDKVRHAQAANYSAAIIHNVNSSDLEVISAALGDVLSHLSVFIVPEPMSAKNSTGIRIPSVFVGEQAGVIIRDHYQWRDGYYVVINDDMPFNINTHLLLPFAIVVGISFLVGVIFTVRGYDATSPVGERVVKCIKDRRRQQRHRLPSSSLKKIPISKFTKGDPYETCAICLEDYQEGEKLRVLPCSHGRLLIHRVLLPVRVIRKELIDCPGSSRLAYHCKCIDPWLTKNRRVCPVCKRKVFAHDERVSDSGSDTETDDTTPLVRGETVTQQGGGTFAPQRVSRPDPDRRREDTLNFNFVSSGEHSINTTELDQSGSRVALLGSQEGAEEEEGQDAAATALDVPVTTTPDDGKGRKLDLVASPLLSNKIHLTRQAFWLEKKPKLPLNTKRMAR
uniref:RING-type domain-containing protein n=1 Tax=Timema poppense TaxID=170557 RepID=A0A7R9DAU6_TIMPO|nr:unnamed protein product [Timema poppensis]